MNSNAKMSQAKWRLPRYALDNCLFISGFFQFLCQMVSLGKIYEGNILSVDKKLPVSKLRYSGKYILQLNGYFYIHVSGRQQTGLRKRTSSTSPGTMVHVLFVLFAVFENMKAYFSEVYTPLHTQNIFIENATKMV